MGRLLEREDCRARAALDAGDGCSLCAAHRQAGGGIWGLDRPHASRQGPGVRHGLSEASQQPDGRGVRQHHDVQAGAADGYRSHLPSSRGTAHLRGQTEAHQGIQRLLHQLQ